MGKLQTQAKTFRGPVKAHNRTTIGRTVVDETRDDYPEVFRLAPRWSFTLEAMEQAVAEFKDLSTSEVEALDRAFSPRLEVIIELPHVCAIFVTRESSLYDYIVSKSGVDMPQTDKPLSVITVSRCLRESWRADGKTVDELMKYADQYAMTRYVVRSAAADRYVERKSSLLKRRHGRTKSNVEEITVRLDAPTLRYRVDRLVEAEEQERQARGPVCQHSVREFLRQLKSGKVVYVRPHVRGNASVPRKTHYKIQGKSAGV